MGNPAVKIGAKMNKASKRISKIRPKFWDEVHK